MSILLYGCTTWTLTKQMEKKLDGNYTRMLRAILNKSWNQHPTKQQLYGHLPPITKTIQDEPDMLDTAGEAGTSSQEMYSYGPPHIAEIDRQGDLLEPTYSSSVRIRDVALRTCQKWGMREWVARAVQGYPCWGYDKMMMMLIEAKIVYEGLIIVVVL